ncbi:MAG TPA: cytochrome c3 family protein [Polyangiaceae bacterium]|nr:cytochrome c3 family protein [Polyangiaceae bacterium]
MHTPPPCAVAPPSRRNAARRGASALLAVLALGCATTEDIHATAEARGQPCVNCHAEAYAAAKSPLHLGAFPETCNQCHTTRSWSPAALPDHHWFSLDGHHGQIACGACHTGDPPRFAGTPTECSGCHLPAYTAAEHPAHVNVLPQTCGDCHGKDAWTPATVKEHPWFVLDGKHLTAPCIGCHTGNPKRFAGTPSDCVACHLADYQRSTFPGHSSFPQTCHDCHDTGGW